SAPATTITAASWPRTRWRGAWAARARYCCSATRRAWRRPRRASAASSTDCAPITRGSRSSRPISTRARPATPPRPPPRTCSIDSAMTSTACSRPTNRRPPPPLEDSGRACKIRFTGFDASSVFVDAMRAGKLDGVVVQNPFRMGELGVKTLVAHLRGKKPDRRVDTGVTMITPANLDGDEARALLHPPLEQYLK